MPGFQNLLVWQKAHLLTLEIYKISADFPAEERYGLTAQFRRSTASIATNIVEGHGRKGRVEYARFLSIANGSLKETKYHLILARDLRFLPASKFETLFGICEEIGRMLHSLKLKVRAQQ